MAQPCLNSLAPKRRERFLGPLNQALSGPTRRDILFLGGQNIRESGGYWIASVCHYVGRFSAPFLDVLPSDHLAFLRSGEFFRITEDGRISEAKIIFELVDLMRQAGRMPLPSLGTELTFPAPQTQDGLLPESDRAERSLELIQRMLGDLYHYDPKTNASQGQVGEGGAWEDDFMWYACRCRIEHALGRLCR